MSENSVCQVKEMSTEKEQKWAYLVQLFVKLAELGHFLHDLLPHEEGRVQHDVVLAMEDPQGVVDQSLLQEHQRPLNTAEGGDGSR